jgi:hypothetical protein
MVVVRQPPGTSLPFQSPMRVDFSTENNNLCRRPAMHETARRIDGGAPLRDAMERRSLGLDQLAALTAAADPTGRGISMQLVWFLSTRRPRARGTTSLRTAALIEDALEYPRGSLFEQVTVYAKSDPQPTWTSL